MPFRIVSADAIKVPRGSYPPHGWPLEQLQVGQAFVIPMDGDADLDGRPAQYVRFLVSAAGKRLNRSLSVNKLPSGDFAVTRRS